jgi:hypothetical protein
MGFLWDESGIFCCLLNLVCIAGDALGHCHAVLQDHPAPGTGPFSSALSLISTMTGAAILDANPRGASGKVQYTALPHGTDVWCSVQTTVSLAVARYSSSSFLQAQLKSRLTSLLSYNQGKNGSACSSTAGQ